MKIREGAVKTYKFLTLGLLLLLSSKAFALPNWMNLIAQGRDKEAAQELEKTIQNLPAHSNIFFVDQVLYPTVDILKHAHKTTDNTGVYVFRGITLGDSDYWTKGKKPFFPSKALRDKRKFRPTNLIGREGEKKFKYEMDQPSFIADLMRDHSIGTHNKSTPFVSVAIDSTTAAISNTMLILRVHPQRLLDADSTFFREAEALIPLYIHPNEVVAIIQEHNSSENDYHSDWARKGNFKILYNGEKRMSEKALRKKVLDLIKKNIPRTGSSLSNYSDRFSANARKKLRSANYTARSGESCRTLFIDYMDLIYRK